MAKKKAKKSKRTSRRRVGSVKSILSPDSMILKLGAVAVGFLMADTINGLIDKVASTLDPKIVGAGEMGLGAALMFMKIGKGKPSLLQVVPGGVLAGAGLKRELKALNLIHGIGGYQSVNVLGQRMMESRRMNGYGNVNVLGRKVAGYTTANEPIGTVFNGYNVPPVPRSQVVGCMDSSGSGLSGDGGGYLN